MCTRAAKWMFGSGCAVRHRVNATPTTRTLALLLALAVCSCVSFRYASSEMDCSVFPKPISSAKMLR